MKAVYPEVLSYFFIIQEQWAFEKYALDLISSGGTDGPPWLMDY
jgi:hypothetical protein